MLARSNFQGHSIQSSSLSSVPSNHGDVLEGEKRRRRHLG